MARAGVLTLAFSLLLICEQSLSLPAPVNGDSSEVLPPFALPSTENVSSRNLISRNLTRALQHTLKNLLRSEICPQTEKPSHTDSAAGGKLFEHQLTVVTALA